MPNYNRLSTKSKQEARALRPSQFQAKWREFEQKDRQLRQTVTQLTGELSTDPAVFFEQVIGFKPYLYQKEFIDLFESNQFTAARWCRQSGKTQTISALLLKYAVTHQTLQSV